MFTGSKQNKVSPCALGVPNRTSTEQGNTAEILRREMKAVKEQYIIQAKSSRDGSEQETKVHSALSKQVSSQATCSHQF
jgi:hypothetical protein